MKFRDLETLLLRRELERGGFYEDIIFPDEKGKEGRYVRESVEGLVTKWLYNLWKCKEIKIVKFKDLFNVLNEIVFPIKITTSYGEYSFRIRFIDNEGKEYHMIKTSINDSFCMQNYMIMSLEPLEIKEFYYHISESEGIILTGTTITEKNSNTTIKFNYQYESEITEAEIQQDGRYSGMKIQYPKINEEIDEKVLTFFLGMSKEKWYYYDVRPVLKSFLMLLHCERASISITAKVKDEISSKVEVVNGIVQEYITTKIISEGEIEIKRKIFAKRLEDFLGDNS
jgi:hypothetical protein